MKKVKKLLSLTNLELEKTLRLPLKRGIFCRKFINDISEVRSIDKVKRAELDKKILRLTDGAIKDYESRIRESKNRESVLSNLTKVDRSNMNSIGRKSTESNRQKIKFTLMKK